jgi:chromatin segregation and condensation protein Rec8/ScpA/Scc1 (kleisin family)
VTLFSLLELYKRGEADWVQDESFGPILIEPRAVGRAPAGAVA